MKKKSFTKDLLGTGGFLMVNKALVRLLSFDASILIAVFADCQELHGEEFYQTTDQILHFTYGYMGEKKQRTAIKLLEESGCIEVTWKGMPKRRWLKLNEERIMEMINNENA
ncbi:MAG: hypothetical protein ACRCTF_10400 [Bacteroidales bacterium]